MPEHFGQPKNFPAAVQVQGGKYSKYRWHTSKKQGVHSLEVFLCNILLAVLKFHKVPRVTVLSWEGTEIPFSIPHIRRGAEKLRD